MYHSPSDTILKTSASFFINGKTWWYSSIYLIHNFCDSFQESLKLIYMLMLHFIFLFVQSAIFNFYEHDMQTMHYSMFALIWWHVAVLEIYNRKCNEVQSKLKKRNTSSVLCITSEWPSQHNTIVPEIMNLMLPTHIKQFYISGLCTLL